MEPVLDLKHPPIIPRVEPSETPSAVELLEALAAGPSEVEWEAEHSLSDTARRRHYMVLAAFALLGGGVAFWQGSWLTFLVVFLGIATWELRERFSKPVQVHINQLGLHVNGHRYQHAQLASFDIHHMPDGAAELSIRTDSWHTPLLRLPLGQQDPDQVRAVLQQYIQEDAHGIPLIEWFIRKE